MYASLSVCTIQVLTDIISSSILLSFLYSSASKLIKLEREQ